MNKRGIVVTAPFVYDGKTLKVGPQMTPDSMMLRFYLLYWDKIDWPDNNLIHVPVDASAETAFLANAGILTRTKIDYLGQINVEEAFAFTQDAAFIHRAITEPGLWSIAQTGNKLFLPKASIVKKRKIDLELYQALPVPDVEVSLDDILQFKERRNNELIAFRALMDEIYLEITSSGDIPRAKTAAITKLQTSIVELHKVMHESLIKRRLSTIKVELNLSSMIQGILAGDAAATVFGISPEVASAIGMAVAAIKFSINIGPMRKDIPDSLKDFAYLHYIGQELL